MLPCCQAKHRGTGIELPFHCPATAGLHSAGCGNSGFSGQTWGEDLVWLCRNIQKSLECGLGYKWRHTQDGAQAHQRSPSQYRKGCV